MGSQEVVMMMLTLLSRAAALSALVVAAMSACADDTPRVDVDSALVTGTTDVARSAPTGAEHTVGQPSDVTSIDCESFSADELNAVFDRAGVAAGIDFSFGRFDETLSPETLGPRFEVGDPGPRWCWMEDGSGFAAGASWMTDGHWTAGGTSVVLTFGTDDVLLDDHNWQSFGYQNHPLLDESVHYELKWSFPSGMEMNLWTEDCPFARISLRFVPIDWNASGDIAPEYEAFSFAVANEMVREMGWIT